MDLLQLKYFVRVAEQGSFSNAAAQLHIAQPTLSRSVRALEVELKANLFHRNGRGVQLTPAGRRLLDHARGIMRGFDAARHAVREEEASYEGRVAIGLPPSIGKLLILPLAKQFRKKFPKASLSIVEGLSSGLYDQLATGRLDFAVLRNPIASPHMSIERVTTEAFYLVGAKPIGRRNKDVGLKDLIGLPFLMPSAPHTFRPLLDAAMARMGTVLNIAFEVDAIGSLMEMAEAGLGYTISPESTMRMSSPNSPLSWQKIAAPEFSSTLCLVTPSRQPQTQLPVEAARLTYDILITELGIDQQGKGASKASVKQAAVPAGPGL
jgi:LysR family nitrogen assimilation transcriptional regulator